MTSVPVEIGIVPELSRRKRLPTLRRACRSWRTRIGLLITGIVVLIALGGPFVAPHETGALVAAPYSPSGPGLPLGSDYLGHDVLSRVLAGGRSVLWMSLAATVLGMTLGISLGLFAGYARRGIDSTIMAGLDVILAFPQFVLPILFVSMMGPKLWLVVLLVALAHAPRVARLTRATTQDVVAREYIEACEVLGVPRWRILFREVLPNITTPLMVEFGIRMTWSIGIVAGISFLGFGIQPPNADWGLMINENRSGVTIQPWSIVAPVVCIAMFTIGTNLITEGYARAVAGVSERRRG
jgi:peptide/nickel transport system permease protein